MPNTKTNSTTNRQRYLALHHCLSGQMIPGKTHWTLAELAASVEDFVQQHYGLKESGIKEDTLYRDLGYLEKDLGVPLDSKRQPQGKADVHFYTDPNFNLFEHFPIEEEDPESVGLALDLLDGYYGPLKLTNRLEDFFMRLRKRFGRQLESLPEGTVRFERSFGTGEPQFFEQLLEAIRKRQALKVRHQRFQGEPRERIIHPTVLKEYQSRWYIFSRDDYYDNLNLMALDRILQVEPLHEDEKAYKPLAQSTVNHYLNGRIGVGGVNQAPQEVRFLCDDWQINYLETRPLHPSQHVAHSEEKGWQEVRLYVAVNYELLAQLLSLGPAIIPVAPEGLVGEYRDKLQAMQAQLPA